MLANYWDVKFLHEISPVILEQLQKIKADRCEYSNGTIVYFDGDSVDAVGFVLKGMLKASQYTKGGKEINIHYFGEGDILPEYMIFSGVQRYSYNLVSVKNSVIDWIPLNIFFELLDSDQRILKSLLKYVCHRGYQSELLLHCLHYKKVSERLASYLLNTDLEEQNGWLCVSYSQKVLADKLNVSRSVLNQELIAFEELGWIKRSNGRIKVLRRDALEGIL